MTAATESFPSNSRIDAAALFKKLGLTVADERPIMAGWREANDRWRQQRREQIAAHARRVRKGVQDIGCKGRPNAALTPGRAKAVWCVELRRQFPSMSAAARFVGHKASNISQAISRGGWCGPYHWEVYDRKAE